MVSAPGCAGKIPLLSFRDATTVNSVSSHTVLADNDPAEQEKLIKLNTLLANLVIFHNALDIMDVVRKLVAEGWLITADQLGAMSPYIRAHIKAGSAPTPLTTSPASPRPSTRSSRKSTSPPSAWPPEPSARLNSRRHSP